MTEPRRPIPRLYVELHRLGELPPDVDPELRARLDAGEGDLGGPDDATALRELPPSVIAAAARAAAPPSRRRAPALALVAGLAVAAVALFVVRPPETPGEVQGDRIKGLSPALLIHRDGDDAPLRPGGAVAEGDRLQVRMQPAGRAYGVLFSVDGRGVLTEHARLRGAPAGEVTVPDAYVLDDAPDFEAFHLVVADAPFDVDAVLAAARAAGPRTSLPPLPDGLAAVSVVLRKEAR